MIVMAKPFPREFRDDVLRVFRSSPAGTTVRQVAADFGISESCLAKWLKQADAKSSGSSGIVNDEESRELRKRVKLLEQENEVLRRAAAYLSQANLHPKK